MATDQQCTRESSELTPSVSASIVVKCIVCIPLPTKPSTPPLHSGPFPNPQPHDVSPSVPLSPSVQKPSAKSFHCTEQQPSKLPEAKKNQDAWESGQNETAKGDVVAKPAIMPAIHAKHDLRGDPFKEPVVATIQNRESV
ncbi:hypothetical protein NA56DRAFT_711720 [Hyaloscypha hepaticicola]|uniref:Uncharacterized protein n=1 Tax=Hyaloscypha hepaticicola TaxID=2082293 RepID=A0A2J6PI42_9HELO|nr:hypothetical protein NA56DRAFT_711720 [Hyaloscypha hepaticicola]